MYLAASRRHVEPRVGRCSIAGGSTDRDIRDFVAGKTDGEQLLHALYDHVLDEPIPEHLLALLRR